MFDFRPIDDGSIIEVFKINPSGGSFRIGSLEQSLEGDWYFNFGLGKYVLVDDIRQILAKLDQKPS